MHQEIYFKHLIIEKLGLMKAPHTHTHTHTHTRNAMLNVPTELYFFLFFSPHLFSRSPGLFAFKNNWSSNNWRTKTSRVRVVPRVAEGLEQILTPTPLNTHTHTHTHTRVTWVLMAGHMSLSLTDLLPCSMLHPFHRPRMYEESDTVLLERFLMVFTSVRQDSDTLYTFRPFVWVWTA